MAREFVESNVNRLERQEQHGYASIAATAWNQRDIRAIGTAPSYDPTKEFGALELVAQSQPTDCCARSTDNSKHQFSTENSQPQLLSDISKDNPNYRKLAKEYFGRQAAESTLLADAQNAGHTSEASNQELKNKTHHWKVPGVDDGYKGWKPGDKFNPCDFETWRESVRVYVLHFMKLNGIDKDSVDGERFRNAFQHELAAGAFQKQSGANAFCVDAVGVGQELYQVGKNVAGLYAGAALIDAGGRGNEAELVHRGKKIVAETSRNLGSMFPTDTLLDLANNHTGASIAEKSRNWGKFLLDSANSAAQAPLHEGFAQ